MKLNWLFFIFLPAFCHADFTTHIPNDFKDYYLNFRDSILTGNTDNVLALTCDKFTAINVDESVPFPKKKRVISHQKMKKNDLVDRFLESEAISTEAIDSNGRYYSIDIYENDKELIKDNENINVIKKVPADWKAFSLSQTDIQLGGLFFSKGKSGWCWSSANYMRLNDDKW